MAVVKSKPKAKSKLKSNRAELVYRAQDEETRRAIDEMIEAMSQMADSSAEAQWLPLAIRLCEGAYEWDIRVANFKPVRKRNNV